MRARELEDKILELGVDRVAAAVLERGRENLVAEHFAVDVGFAPQVAADGMGPDRMRDHGEVGVQHEDVE